MESAVRSRPQHGRRPGVPDGLGVRRLRIRGGTDSLPRPPSQEPPTVGADGRRRSSLARRPTVSPARQHGSARQPPWPARARPWGDPPHYQRRRDLAGPGPPGGHARAADVSCPSVRDCAAVGFGSGSWATTDGGRTWTRQPVRPGWRISVVSHAPPCPFVRPWGIARRHAVALRTTDGGARWSVQAVP